MDSWYVAHVFPKWFRNGASRSNYYYYYYHYHPRFLLHNSLSGSQKNMVSLTKHYSFTVMLKLDCRACIKYYCFMLKSHWSGWRLSSFKLSCDLSGIVPAVDSSNGVTQTVSSCNVLITFSFMYTYGVSRWWCCEHCGCWESLPLAIRRASFMVLTGISTSGLMLWIVRSVTIELSWYNL